jgi:hypothetical protein
MDGFYFDFLSPCYIPVTPIQLPSPPPPPIPKFKAAGCFFTDEGERYVLAGYQQTKTIPKLSGIGGAKLSGETPVQTALRETVEELFDIEKVPRCLLQELEVNVPPRRVVQNHSYQLVCYTFEDLELILMILASRGIKTTLYDTFPKTIHELLFQRKVRKEAEISHLALLPFVEHQGKNPLVCPLLLADMKLLLTSDTL